MDFEAAIFDLDGTLLNSMDVWEQIDIAFLKKRNLPVPADYVTEICARSFEEAAQYTIDLFGLAESAGDIIDEWNDMAAYEYAHNIKLLPYALDYLLHLKANGIKLAVATGLPRKLFLPCLENNSVLGLFDTLCSTDEVGRGKEFPDVFELAAKRLQAAPQRCIVFDDALPAIRSAKQANMIVCGVYDKYSAIHRTEIERLADYYVFDFKAAPLPCKGV
ncbi:MAG: HAD family phosphatase [Oscillospiraceae bacterium]|nr:HAD family phosphatase [Oscillospiraceae bacterium]